jgi:hypothetical protein
LFQITENVFGGFRNIKSSVWGEAMSRTQTHEWNKRFEDGRASFEGIEGSGRPSASTNHENIQEVWKVIHSKRRLTFHEVAAEAGI